MGVPIAVGSSEDLQCSPTLALPPEQRVVAATVDTGQRLRDAAQAVLRSRLPSSTKHDREIAALRQGRIPGFFFAQGGYLSQIKTHGKNACF